jgi:helix-turn-helix protein
VQRAETPSSRRGNGRRPIEIKGVKYFSVASVARAVGVSRQTVWRWRLDGKIPAGHLYRSHQTIFTIEEVEAVREFANRVELISEGPARQLKLFNGVKKEGP